MSVSLPTSNPTLKPEYAATTIQFTRNMVPNGEGHIEAVFGAQIVYQRTDYLQDADGNKVAVVQRNPLPLAPGQTDPYQGFIYLTQEQLLALSPSTPTVNVLEAIADAADALIHADLVARNILTV